MLAIGAFSVVIYYWALEVSLRKEQIEEMLEEVVLPEKEGLGAVVG